MPNQSVTGTSARGAVIRGLLLGLVLQALMIGAIEVVGAPVDPDVAALSGPPPAELAALATLADARR